MADKSVRIEVHGAKELRRKIKQAEDQGLKDELKKVYKDVSTLVSTGSKRWVPVQSGDLRDTIRPLNQATRAVVAVGRGKVNDYAGVVIWGDPKRNIRAQNFIHEEIQRDWDPIYRVFTSGVDRVVDQINQ